MPSNSSYAGFVYFLGSTKFGWYKIGKSADAQVRIHQIGILLPFKISLLALWRSSNRHLLEQLMHEKYAPYAINGEWFGFSQNQALKVISEEQPFDAHLEIGKISFSNIVRDYKNSDDSPNRLTKRIRRVAAAAFMKIHALEDIPRNWGLAYDEVHRLYLEGKLNLLEPHVLYSEPDLENSPNTLPAGE